MSDKPYSAAKLARRWSIPKSKIYEMVRDGDLASFRVNGQLLRIAAEEVARHENLHPIKTLRSS